MLQKCFRADKNPRILQSNQTGQKSFTITLETPCNFIGKDATSGCSWKSNFNWKVLQWSSCHRSEPNVADKYRGNAANDIPSTITETANF